MWRDLKLAVGILALQFQPAGAQNLPTLRGYQLGTSLGEARVSRLPCQLMDTRLRCDAPDSVHLFFQRDTLTGIMVDLDMQSTRARERWFAVADSFVALYGDPDSVRVKMVAIGPPMATTLRAYWAPMTASRPWGLTYNVIEFQLDDHVTSTAYVSLDACLWKEQAPLCANVLEGRKGKQPSRDKRP